MDESLKELETELQRLTPRRLSAGALAALERELGPATPAKSEVTAPATWKWISWSLAAAAALAIAGVVQLSRRTGPEQVLAEAPAAPQASAPAPEAAQGANRYEPVGATTVLYDMKEDGQATLVDQTQARQVRYRYVDTYTWKNPATNASLRWSVPRDEVRLVRASLD